VLIDGANPSFIKSLKIQWDERPEYGSGNKEYYKYMKVEPVTFGKEYKEMLENCKMLPYTINRSRMFSILLSLLRNV
jgi:hypothetical protein